MGIGNCNGNEDLGMFAVSRAGHDAGNVYVIIREMGGDVYLADGDLKGIDNPKRKNRKHLQIIRKGASVELIGKLRNNQAVSNEEIKYTIKSRFK